ncbi:MAG: helix-hairpin-helix domain-containing protein [Gemmatimonadota bacterium]
MSQTERRAVLLLVALAIGGQAIRLWLLRPEGAPGAIHLLGPDSSGSAAAHRDSAAVAGRPLGPGERIDLDRASARELARLPQVGPALAGRIVADREARGPFGGLDGLDRVSGIGPGLIGRLKDHVEFSGKPLPAGLLRPDSALQPPPPTDTARGLVSINHAGVADLDRLPGVGPSLAGKLVAWRQAHGPFGKIEDLLQVPGVGPAILGRIRERVTLGD